MQKKLSLLCALFSFLVCYLEWGQNNSSFIFEVEYLILFQKSGKADSFMHPLILLPFVGQLLILYALFQKSPRKSLVFSGLSLMGLLVVLVLLVGILSRNPKIALSTVPFLLSSLWYIWVFRSTSSA